MSFVLLLLNFLKKISYDGSHGTATENGDINRLIIVDGKKHHDVEEDEEEEDDELYDFYGNRKGGWKRYFTYHKNDSCLWIWLQISWRILLSLLLALLVFYIVTKPPSPKVQIEISKIREFKLAEGVDRTGVTTKILTCNCSLNLVIENKSKFFGLHIRPPLTDMSFGIFPFAFSHGPKLYAESGYTVFSLQVGTKDKVMYGAGRSMQDMLDSESGLPIVIRVSLSSSFRVVPNLIKPKFHHQAQCLVLLHKAYDKKHRTQVFKSSCRVTS
ncbi:hypothetical protein L6164_023013 [Bauhinia variegata]|uniref:Uncharacterized protein n=1 Tax=Bauhinia variegata TaxID=167791 RepID=A0ACB9MI92_BAUVA|nr:hypothetical protein L6164_023013 [Bauhinia variegata]